MVHQLDAGPERRLKEVSFRRCHAVPLQRMEVGSEVSRRIHPLDGPQTVRLGLMDLRSELELPENLKGPALVVVVQADELDQRRVPFRWRRHNVLDEPLTMSDLDDVPPPWGVPGDGVCGEQRLRWR